MSENDYIDILRRANDPKYASPPTLKKTLTVRRDFRADAAVYHRDLGDGPVDDINAVFALNAAIDTILKHLDSQPDDQKELEPALHILDSVANRHAAKLIRGA